VIGEKRLPEWDDLSHLKYIELIINETLRLYAPIQSGRQITESLRVDDKITIPKDSLVWYSNYAMAANSDLWGEDPLSFKPERMDQDYDKFTFLPFGYGKRNCIGYAMATSQLKLYVAALVQRFDFKLQTENIKIISTGTLIPKDPLLIKFVPL